MKRIRSFALRAVIDAWNFGIQKRIKKSFKREQWNAAT